MSALPAMRGKRVHLDDVSVRFGALLAVQPTTLTIEAGEFFSILGPSGCGKTTLLRTISGFVPPEKGRVLIGDIDVTSLGPNARPTAMIFQNLALFPLMTVAENVAFGLEARGVARGERLRRATALLSFVDLTGQGAKKPNDLSGGQRQRVAIARALAVDPAVLLLDEPLSALDLKLRHRMRVELRALQRKSGVTFLTITHDQGEALTMSDRVAVMNAGRIEQVGTPRDIYENPRTPFAATFVGAQNVIPGTVSGLTQTQVRLDTAFGPLEGRATPDLKVGQRAALYVRPEKLQFGSTGQIGATVEATELEGPYEVLHARAGDLALTIHAQTGPGCPEIDDRITLGFDATAAVVFPILIVRNLSASLGRPLAVLVLALVAFWVAALVIVPLATMVGASVVSQKTNADAEAELDRAFVTLATERYDLRHETDESKRTTLSAQIERSQADAVVLDSQMTAPGRVYGAQNFLAMSGLHVRIFGLTVLYAILVAALSLIVCYPVACAVAFASTPRRATVLLALLIAPSAMNELLRVYAWTMMFDVHGLINQTLTALGLNDPAQPIRFLDSQWTVFAVLLSVYILFMVFPILSALQTLDRNQVEAARDLGASTIRTHWRVILPHAKPGIAAGCITVFMLAAGTYAVPQIVSRGVGGDWFSQLIYRQFFESENWGAGAAYSTALMAVCLIVVFVAMRLFRVGLEDLSR